MRHNERFWCSRRWPRDRQVQGRGEHPALARPRRFARVSAENDYPIVPVALVGGDDVYRSLITREGRLGRLSQRLSEKLSGRRDMALPLLQGMAPP